jgi:hypothetical protein
MQAKFLTPIVALVLAPAGSAVAADPPAPEPAAAAPAPAAVPAPAPAGIKFSATLTGPAEEGKGDPDGTGSFSARIDKGQLCYTISSANIDDPTMAHIHKGAPGVAGPVFIGLSDLDPGEHCEDIDQERLDALTSKPQDYYVNIHNGDFPAGAVRGQLTKQ